LDHPYLSWSKYEELPLLDVAVVAVNAQSHCDVVVTLSQLDAPPKVIVCEKPGGDSREEFQQMRLACDEHGVRLLIADHYLLRPTIQEALRSNQLGSISNSLTQIHGYALEKDTGGPAQGAHTDILVHLVNLLRTLLPQAIFQIEQSVFAQAQENPYADVTYIQVNGHLLCGAQDIELLLEAGKHLPADRKEILFQAENVELRLDLSSGGDWSYEELVGELLRDMCPAEEATVSLGALSSRFMLQTWGILANTLSTKGEILQCTTGSLPHIDIVGSN